MPPKSSRKRALAVDEAQSTSAKRTLVELDWTDLCAKLTRTECVVVCDDLDAPSSLERVVAGLNQLFKGLLDGGDSKQAALWLREAHVDPMLMIGAAGGSSTAAWVAPTELRWGDAGLGPLFSRLPWDKVHQILDELPMVDKLALTQASASLHSVRTTHEFWAHVDLDSRGSSPFLRADRAADLLALAPPDSIKTLIFGALKPHGKRSKSLEPDDVIAIYATLAKQRRIERLRLPREMFLAKAIGKLVEVADFSHLKDLGLWNGSGREQASPRVLAPLFKQAAQGLKTISFSGTIGGSGFEALEGGVVETISLLDMRVGKDASRQPDEVTFDHLRRLHRYPKLKDLRLCTVFGTVDDEDDMAVHQLYSHTPAFMTKVPDQPLPCLTTVVIEALYASLLESTLTMGPVVNGLLRQAPLLETLKITALPTYLMSVEGALARLNDDEMILPHMGAVAFKNLPTSLALTSLTLHWFEFEANGPLDDLLALNMSLRRLEISYCRGVPVNLNERAVEAGILKK